MDESELKRLIEKKIDAELSPEEADRLQTIVESDPDARQLVKDQVSAAAFLDELSSVEPPPNLKKRILNSIDPNLYRVRDSKKRTLRLRPAMRVRTRWVVAFAVGLLLGILVPLTLRLGQDPFSRISSTDFIGTIGLHESKHFTEIEKLPIRLPNMEGSMIFKTFGDVIGCEVHLDSRHECELSLEFGPENLAFYGFHPFGQTKIRVENGDVIRTSSIDDVRYVLFVRRLNEQPARMQVVLRSEGSVVYSREVEINAVK
jgi:hypothetical protein